MRILARDATSLTIDGHGCVVYTMDRTPAAIDVMRTRGTQVTLRNWTFQRLVGFWQRLELAWVVFWHRRGFVVVSYRESLEFETWASNTWVPDEPRVEEHEEASVEGAPRYEREVIDDG